MPQIKWNIDEDEYIEKYYLIKSDKEIAEHLNKTELQIRTRRVKLGFKKQRQTFNKESPDGMKWCWYCSKFHTVDQFNKNKTRPDGLQDECRKAVKLIKLNRESNKNKKAINIKEKECTECETTKTIDNFIKNVSTNDGYSNICKQCLNKTDITKKFKTMEGNV